MFSIYATSDAPTENDQDPSQSVELRIDTTIYGEQTTVVSQTWPVSAIETDGRWSRLAIQTVAPGDHLRVLVLVHSLSNEEIQNETLKLDEARLGIFEPGGYGCWMGFEEGKP